MLHRGAVVLFLALLAGTGQGSTDWGGPERTPPSALFRPSSPPVTATPFLAWNALDVPLPAGDVQWQASCVQDVLDDTGAIHLRWRAEDQVDGTVQVRLLIRPSEDYVARGRRTGDWLPGGGAPEQIVLITRWRAQPDILLDWSLRNAADGRILHLPVRLRLTLSPEGMEVTHQLGDCHLVHNP